MRISYLNKDPVNLHLIGSTSKMRRGHRIKSFRSPSPPSKPPILRPLPLCLICDLTEAYSNPLTTVLVFVFLLSRSGNSIGVWRRKLMVPPVLQMEYGDRLQEVKEELRGTQYRVKLRYIYYPFLTCPFLRPSLR